MKPHNAITTVLFLAIYYLPTKAQVAETNPTIEVLQVLQEYDHAWQKRDTAKVRVLLADDYVYFTSTGGLSSKAESIITLASPDYILEDAERTEIEVRVTGSAAIVSSRWRGHGTWKTKPFVDDQRCSLVFLKTNAGWKLLAEHCTQIKKPSE